MLKLPFSLTELTDAVAVALLQRDKDAQRQAQLQAAEADRATRERQRLEQEQAAELARQQRAALENELAQVEAEQLKTHDRCVELETFGAKPGIVAVARNQQWILLQRRIALRSQLGVE